MLKKYRLLTDGPAGKIGEELILEDFAVRHQLERGLIGEVPTKPDFEGLVREKTQELAIEQTAREAFQSALGTGRKSIGAVLKEMLGNPEARRKSALITTSGGAGGYLDEQTFVVSMPFSGEAAVIRPGARVIPTASKEQLRPRWRLSESGVVGVSPLLGGLSLAWTPENVMPPESEPSAGLSSLVLNILGGTIIVNNGWLRDAALGTIDAQLFQLIEEAITWTEDYAFLQGNGVGQPLGILNSPCSLFVARSVASEVTFTDYDAMISKLLPESFNRAVWLCSPSAVGNMMQLKDGTNRAISLTTVAPNGRPQMSIGPHPLYVTEKLPALGTTGDVMLVDRAYYDIADFATEKQQAAGVFRSLAISYSSEASEAYFGKNQSAFLVGQRVDGRPRLDGPITLQDGVSQVSPFVVLQ